MFRTVLNVLLASALFILMDPVSASAQPFLTFGGSVVGVNQDAVERDHRLDSPGFGIEVGGAFPLMDFIGVSGGLGLDSHGLTPGGGKLDVLARRLAVGLEVPGLYFNGDKSKAIFYFGADAGYEWLGDVMLKGSSYFEPHARICFSEALGHLWGVNVAWRSYSGGGSFTRRLIVGGTLTF